MQKSLEGLLRGLIYSILLSLSQSDLPNKLGAIAKICSSRSYTNAHSAWSRKELKDILTGLTSVSGVRSFFLIDALDECEPQDNLGDLAAEILWISQLPNVKLCVSHRPWAVFTRKFEHASTLRLDRLTLRDMETYVRGRLTIVEEEKGWYTDFGNQTQAAEQFVHRVAHDAEGVFLWIELVVKAICSEMRKGKQLQQLDRVFSDFPTDLDDYFRKLIFDRIGRSRQNIKDTTAALRLAVNINTFEISAQYQGSTKFGEKSPFARSLINFWLLSNGHLRPGFSWQDHEQIVQPCSASMMSHTASYLEETCKDLLILNRATREVDFLHRTVYDFLTANKANDRLELDSPAHFSDGDFIFNLAKLRCICIIREDANDPNEKSSTLDRILRMYTNLTHLDATASWLLACESLTILKMQKSLGAGNYSQLLLPMGSMSALCAKAGLVKIALERYKHLPCLALTCDEIDLGLQGVFLCAAIQTDGRDPDLVLYRCIMEYGCDPNARTGSWPYFRCQQYLLSSEDRRNRIDWCARTLWQAFLGKHTYRYSDERTKNFLDRSTKCSTYKSSGLAR